MNSTPKPAKEYPRPAGSATYADCKTKAEKVAFLRWKTSTDQAWAEKALLTIWKFQTACEKSSEATTDHNGVGFSGFDARSASYLVKWLEAGKKLDGKFLAKAFKLAPKYAEQIRKIADGEVKAPVA